MAEGEQAAVEAQVEVVATAKPVVDESVPLVLVTGATGYVATHVIQQLLTSGNYRVRGTIRSLKNEEKVKALKELVPDAKYHLDLCEADLLNKESWSPAVQGCKYVHHIASPFPASVPKNPDEVILPAVNGTLNVLTACAESGSVKRVVVTSSLAAISCGLKGHPNRTENVYSEDDWSPPEACETYERSKTLAEKAAWDFVKELPEEKKIELVVVNPGGVFGPLLTQSPGTSVNIVNQIISGTIPGYVDVNIPMVDVRDVAQAHIVAMEKPECSGKRYILVSELALLQEMFQWLSAEFGPQGYKVSAMKIPKFVAWFASFFSSDMKLLYPSIGKRITFNNERMVNVLGIQPRGAKQSVLDTAYSLVENGVVPKTPGYHGPGGLPAGQPQKVAANDEGQEKTDDGDNKEMAEGSQKPEGEAGNQDEKQAAVPTEDSKDDTAEEKPSNEGTSHDEPEAQDS